MDFYKKYDGIPRTYARDSEDYLIYDGKAYIKALEDYADDKGLDAATVIADYRTYQKYLLSFGNKKTGKK